MQYSHGHHPVISVSSSFSFLCISGEKIIFLTLVGVCIYVCVSERERASECVWDTEKEVCLFRVENRTC